eukprot:3959218-Prymnesium_polylepis.1
MVGTSAISDVASISFSRRSAAGGFSHGARGSACGPQDQQTCTDPLTTEGRVEPIEATPVFCIR